MSFIDSQLDGLRSQKILLEIKPLSLCVEAGLSYCRVYEGVTPVCSSLLLTKVPQFLTDRGVWIFPSSLFHFLEKLYPIPSH